MLSRSHKAVLVLTAAVLVGVGPVLGQTLDAPPPAWPTATPPPAATKPPAAALPNGPAPPPASTDPRVIATSRDQALLRHPTAAPVTVPDDGLQPLPLPPPPPPPPVAQTTAVGNPAPVAAQSAVFRPDADLSHVRPLAAVASSTPATATTESVQRGAQVNVEVGGPAAIAPGDPLHYEIIVRNTGAASAAQVMVEAPLPTGARLLATEPAATAKAGLLSWELGSLEAGGERRLKVDLQYSGKEDFVCSPRVAYTATGCLRTRLIRPPFNVALSGPEATQRGATVSFGIELSNNGEAPLRRVVVRDKLPPGLRHPQGDVIEAEIGELAPGQSRIIHLDVTAVQAGAFVNEVTATADGAAPATSRCTLQVRDGGPQTTTGAQYLEIARAGQTAGVESGSGLQVEMLAQEDPLPAGRETVYLVRILNHGAAPSTNVRLTVLLPDGVTPVQADGPTPCRIAQRQVIADPLPSAASRQMVEYRVRVRGRNIGTWRLEADLTADQLPQPIREQVGVHVTEDRQAVPFASGR